MWTRLLHLEAEFLFQKEGAKVKSILLLLCHPLQNCCLPNFAFTLNYTQDGRTPSPQAHTSPALGLTR